MIQNGNDVTEEQEATFNLDDCPIHPVPGYCVIVREDVPDKVGRMYLAAPAHKREAYRDLMCTALLVRANYEEDYALDDRCDEGSRIMAMVPGNGLEFDEADVRYNVIPTGCIVALVDSDTPQIEPVMRVMAMEQEAGAPGIMR